MKKYTIPKGKHRGVPIRPALYLKQEFAWEVMFDETAKYDMSKIGMSQFQLDIQKLIGIGYLFKDNSARFGWRYNPVYGSAIELMAYTHDNGAVTKSDTEAPIGVLPFKQVGRLGLKVYRQRYDFSFNGRVILSLPKSHNQKLSYKMGPYFECADDIPAQQDIRILIRSVPV